MKQRSSALDFSRRHLLKGTAAVATFSWMAGYSASFRAVAGTRQATAGNQPVPAGDVTQVPLTVSSTTIGAVGPAFAGLAYSKEKILGTLFTGADNSLIDVFKLIGPSSLRIGGSTVDQSVWTPDGRGGQQGFVAPADVDNLAAFLQATHWTCIYGINLGGAATGATNPSLAAAEVAYVAEKLGSALTGIEIGNEPDFYGQNGGPFAGNWSFDEFMAVWNEYRRAIVARTPRVPIAGPANAGDALTWTVPFIEVAGRQDLSLITQHYYVSDALSSNATANELLQVGLHNDLVRELATLKAAAAAIGVPFRMAECSTYFDNSGIQPPVDVAGSYTSALWALDYMFMCAQGGMQGVNFEGGGDVPGYPPLLNDSDRVVAVCPLFYGLQLFYQAGTGALLDTAVSPGSLNVTGYALAPATGGYNIVALNKDPAANIQLQIQLPQSVSSASLIEMTQLTSGAAVPALLATTGVTIQGATIGIDGSFAPGAAYQLSPSGAQVTCFVPPLSAVLIQAA